MKNLSVQDQLLIDIVTEGNGRYSARDIDVRFSARSSHRQETVLASLKRLARAGYVIDRDVPGSSWRRWELVSADEAAKLGEAGVAEL